MLAAVTVIVMSVFVGVRTYLAWSQMELDLAQRANSIAERVSGAVRPTIWNIYRKSEKRQFTEEVASAIVDAELADEFVRGIFVYGNFGHLFLGRIKNADDAIQSIAAQNFKPSHRGASKYTKQPVRQGEMTIGTVEVVYTHAPFVRRFYVSIALEVAQVAVVSVLFVAFLFWAIRQSLLLPTKKLQITKNAVSAMREGVIVLDRNDRVLDANPSFLFLLGYDAAELIDKTIDLADVFDGLPPEIEQAGSEGRDWHGEVVAKPRDGEMFTASLNVNFVTDENLEETIKVLVIEDISDRLRYQSELQRAHDDMLHLVAERTRQLNDIKRTEEKLRTSIEEVKKANAAKSQFLANMSHELRTPLNTIIGYSETLLAKYFGDFSTSKQEEYLKDIHASGAHLLALINDVLDLSKIESATVQLLEEKLDISSVLEVARTQIEHKAVHKGVALDVIDQTNGMKLFGDNRRICQVLINLLDNAVKFTPTGGHVMLRAHCDRSGALLFEIEDTGIGIPEEKIAHIVKPFEQVGDVMNTPQSGTGLGLAICKSLVELHGGTLTIESAFGSGTTVVVTLPAPRVIREEHGVAPRVSHLNR